MPRRRIRADYEQLSEFERGRIIGLKEAGWANLRISRHLGRNDVAIRRFWQEREDKGRFQHQDGSGQPRATANLEDELIQDNAKPNTTRVVMNGLTVYQTLPWPSRSPDPSPIEHTLDIMERLLHLPGNVDNLIRQLEQI
ncbi:HTH_Tnp_Tc3_2 domain-containing protein [Trichonephila clavipes]|nr:HTH_Tnp_Tc3_2 domain-containing protein [Trichonephila clavipes]